MLWILRGDLGALRLVLRLRLALVGDQLGQRRRPWCPACRPRPALVSAAASALPWAMTSVSCLRNSPGAVSAWAAAACLSASACWNSGSLDCASCCSVTSASGHLLVRLVLAGFEVELLGRRGFGHGARGRDRRSGALVALAPSGVTGFGDRLGLVRRRVGRGLDVLGLPLLALT